jgi:hypothetical protein
VDRDLPRLAGGRILAGRRLRSVPAGRMTCYSPA